MTAPTFSPLFPFFTNMGLCQTLKPPSTLPDFDSLLACRDEGCRPFFFCFFSFTFQDGSEEARPPYFDNFLKDETAVLKKSRLQEAFSSLP